VMLFHYTHQRIEHVKQSSNRVDVLKKMFAKHGAKIKEFYALDPIPALPHGNDGKSPSECGREQERCLTRPDNGNG
jgi:hypothetical protein